MVESLLFDLDLLGLSKKVETLWIILTKFVYINKDNSTQKKKEYEWREREREKVGWYERERERLKSSVFREKYFGKSSNLKREGINKDTKITLGKR